MLILTLLAARSTSTPETPAWPSLDLTDFLRRRSSCSHFENSFSEYHFEVQPRTTPRRKPTGCVFWPIGYSGMSTSMVTCEVRLLMRLARPMERAIHRFSV